MLGNMVSHVCINAMLFATGYCSCGVLEEKNIKAELAFLEWSRMRRAMVTVFAEAWRAIPQGFSSIPY